MRSKSSPGTSSAGDSTSGSACSSTWRTIGSVARRSSRSAPSERPTRRWRQARSRSSSRWMRSSARSCTMPWLVSTGWKAGLAARNRTVSSSFGLQTDPTPLPGMFHVKHEAWTRSTDRLGVSASPAQADALEAYEALLAERAIPLGMVSPADRDRLRERHILDSIRAAPLLAGEEGETADLGSGAGLPGIPLAIARPDLRFRLIDIRRRRVAFMELAVETIGLPNVVVEQRSVETVGATFPEC